MALTKVQPGLIEATGTPSSTTFLSGDGVWSAPAALSTASGSAPSYSARAWVNFNGTGTVAIRASGNVSSITDLGGSGLYAINFSTAMSDANYSTAVGGSQDGFTSSAAHGIGVYGISTSSVSVACRSESNTYVDFQFVTAAIFR